MKWSYIISLRFPFVFYSFIQVMSLLVSYYWSHSTQVFHHLTVVDPNEIIFTSIKMSSSQGGVLGKGNLRGEVSPLELPDTSHRFNSNEISDSSQQEGFLSSGVPFCLPRVRWIESTVSRSWWSHWDWNGCVFTDVIFGSDKYFVKRCENIW